MAMPPPSTVKIVLPRRRNKFFRARVTKFKTIVLLTLELDFRADYISVTALPDHLTVNSGKCPSFLRYHQIAGSQVYVYCPGAVIQGEPAAGAALGYNLPFHYHCLPLITFRLLQNVTY